MFEYWLVKNGERKMKIKFAVVKDENFDFTLSF